MADRVDIVVPDLGDFADVEVIEILVAAGDKVAREDGLITLETDKATMDVPASHSGTIDAIDVAVGDTVSSGDVIGSMTVEIGDTVVVTPAPALKGEVTRGDAAVVAPPPAVAEASAAEPRAVPVSKASPELPPVDEAGFSRAHASPSVRKLARELGVNLPQVEGTGPKKRILHDDVKAFVKAVMSGRIAAAAPALPAVPEVDFAKFGEIDVQPLTRIQKISGPRLQASWINLPHVTQHDQADITELEAKRRN